MGAGLAHRRVRAQTPAVRRAAGPRNQRPRTPRDPRGASPPLDRVTFAGAAG